MIESARIAVRATLIAASALIPARIAAQASEPPHQIRFESGALTLIADVYRPVGRGPFPLVIWNHGRAQSPERAEFDPVGAAFVRAGYVMVAPLRRGHGPSQGVWIGAAVDSVKRRLGVDSAARVLTRLLETEQLEDQLAGLAAAKRLPFVDTTRIVVAGCSLGGVETLLGAERPVGYRAGYAISTAAQNWDGNPFLRARLLASVAKIAIPIRMIQPPKDASVRPVLELATEAQRLRRPTFVARVAPATMPDSEQGHCFGGQAGMRNWFPSAIAFFDSVFVSDSAAFARIEQLAGADMATLHIPGMAIAVVSGGRVEYARGFGVASAEKPAPATPTMLFRVGSLSKVVSALAIVAEARARSIPLDAPIGDYMNGLSPRLSRVTLHQLLSHTAGIREEITAAPILDHPDERELVAQLRSWTDTMFFADPGEVESYSNLGYVLAGAFIESASRKRFTDVVAERVLKPIGITDATWSSSTAVTGAYADGHLVSSDGAARVVRPMLTDARHLPPTMLWASALDMARLEIALLDHGRIDGRQALDSAAVDLVISGQAPIPLIAGESYGYGMIVHGEQSVPRVVHSGHIEGYWSAMEIAPSRGRAFVLLQNRYDGSPTATLGALVTMETGGGRPPRRPLPTAAAPANIGDIVGHYVNGSWSFDVIDSAGTLAFRGRTSPTSEQPSTGQLTMIGSDLLSLTIVGPVGATATMPIAIVRDKAGAVKYLYLGERAARKMEYRPGFPPFSLREASAPGRRDWPWMPAPTRRRRSSPRERRLR